MIKREKLVNRISDALDRSRVVALIGPRQCGKTTIARQFVSAKSINYFDLEDPQALARLDQPMIVLQDLTGTIVIDEIQRRPELFPVLRVLADRDPNHAKFLILGSASPELLRQTSESLAGRISIVEMTGFNIDEVGSNEQNALWRRGGFPLSFTAENEDLSFDWRNDFISTFLERDIPQFGIGIPSTTLRRFWVMLAHYHGQIWNKAEVARATQVSERSVGRYIDLLQDLFMVRLLQPWFSNLGKRLVRSPKLYFRDTGLLHTLLGIRTELDLYNHPRSGASWEGFALEEVIKAVKPDEAFFWAKHSGAELDLLIIKDGKRIGVECKRLDAPRITPSMQAAMEELDLQHLWVIYPGRIAYQLSKYIDVLPLSALAEPETRLFE